MTQFTMITRHGLAKDKIEAYTLISDNYQTVTVPAGQLAEMIRTGQANVVNMAVEAKGLVSTNGALDKYTFINTETNMVEGTARAVILNRVEKDGKLIGYTVFTQNGQLREMNVVDATALASKNQLSNGKIRHTAEGDIVSSIGGNYPLRTITMDKAPAGEIKVDIMYSAASVLDNNAVKYTGAIISCTSAVAMSKIADKLTTSNANVRAKVAKLTGDKDTSSLKIVRMGANSVYGVFSNEIVAEIASKAKKVVTKNNTFVVSVLDYNEAGVETVAKVKDGNTAVVSQGSDKGVKVAKTYANEVYNTLAKLIK